MQSIVRYSGHACGAPVGAPSLVDFTSARLGRLCTAAGFGGQAEQAVAAYRLLVHPWGLAPRGQRSSWMSEISDDNTPVEFSVALTQRHVDVRVLLEPQGTQPTVSAYREAALAFHERVERDFGADLRRFRLLQDLFAPPDMHGPFAIWSSVVFSPGSAPTFKAYFNPQARGSDCAPDLVAEALARLGMRAAWAELSRTVMRRGAADELKYFALDLSPGPDARVKIYVRHHDATPADLEAAASLAHSHCPGETLDFTRAMLDGDVTMASRAPFTCSAFTDARSSRPAATTAYVPVCAYAHDDAAVRSRVRAFLERSGQDTRAYDSILGSFANRPLEAGVGMQAWMAHRRHNGTLRLTAYLATEANRVHAPGTVPAPTHPVTMTRLASARPAAPNPDEASAACDPYSNI